MMEWIPEKMCSTIGAYELSIERFKRGWECHMNTNTWKWRVINSGVVVSQGVVDSLEAAQKLAEANVPAT